MTIAAGLSELTGDMTEKVMSLNQKKWEGALRKDQATGWGSCCIVESREL